ncbi:MAG: hypothetical protein R3B47_21535 [Bacteroidia bacterium]
MPTCPGGVVNCLAQDASLRILAGTRQGLYQFDGFVWEQSVPDSGQFGSVSFVAKSPFGETWVGNDSGHVWVLSMDRGWSRFLHKDFDCEHRITGITWDLDSQLWIASYGNGLYGIQDDNLIHVNVENGLPDDQVYDISIDAQGHCWAATDAGLASFFWREDVLQVRTWTTRDGLPDMMIFSVEADQHGVVYAGGFEGGISRFEVEKESFTHLTNQWSEGAVPHLRCNCDGRIFAGTEQGGLTKIFDGEIQTINNKGRVSAQLSDREGNLWTAYHSGEITRAFTPLEIIELPQDKEAFSIAQGPEGDLWVGCSEGLCRYHLNEGRWEEIAMPAKLHIISMFRKGNILWMGTFGDGLFWYNFKTDRVRPFPANNKLPDKNILSISSNEQGIWVATLGGLGLIDSSLNVSTFGKAYGLPGSYIYQAIPDQKDGGLWVASDGKGLFQFDLEQGKALPGFEGESVYALYVDKSSRLWAATESGSLFMEKGDGFESLPTLDAGPFTGIEGDLNGNIFSIGTLGCNWYSPEGSFLLGFDERYGINTRTRNLNASITDIQGRIWATMGNIILCAWPLRLAEGQQLQPKGYLKKVSVLLQEIDISGTVELDHDENHLTFHYGASWHQAPTAVSYRYRLQGYNMDWCIHSIPRRSSPNFLPATTPLKCKPGLIIILRTVRRSLPFSIDKPFWNGKFFCCWCWLYSEALPGFFSLYTGKRLKKISRLEQGK